MRPGRAVGIRCFVGSLTETAEFDVGSAGLRIMTVSALFAPKTGLTSSKRVAKSPALPALQWPRLQRVYPMHQWSCHHLRGAF